jgi:hypothetical protein
MKSDSNFITYAYCYEVAALLVYELQEGERGR